MFHVKHLRKRKKVIALGKYTTQVRSIVEEATKDVKEITMSQRIILACPKVFNFDFPIWLEAYRPILEKKILMHYFNKEIGLETVGLWKLYLEERLNLIMPYYNNLYETTVRDYDWLTDTDSTEQYAGNTAKQDTATFTSKEDVESNFTGKITDNGNETFSNNSAVTTHSSEDSTGNVLESDLPQANYAGVDYGTKLTESNNNVTTDTTQTTTASGESDRSNTTDTAQNATTGTIRDDTNKFDSNKDDVYTRKRKGAFGARSLTDLLMQYRDSLINIDYMVINELSDLFMNIY